MYLCVLKNKLKPYQCSHMGNWCMLGATKPAASHQQTWEHTHSPQGTQPLTPAGAKASQLWVVLSSQIKSPNSIWESHNRTFIICCGPYALFLRWLLTCKSYCGKAAEKQFDHIQWYCWEQQGKTFEKVACSHLDTSFHMLTIFTFNNHASVLLLHYLITPFLLYGPLWTHFHLLKSQHI